MDIRKSNAAAQQHLPLFCVGTVVMQKGDLVFIIPHLGEQMLKISGPPANIVRGIYLGLSFDAIEEDLKRQYTDKCDARNMINRLLAELTRRNLFLSEEQQTHEGNGWLLSSINQVFVRTAMRNVQSQSGRGLYLGMLSSCITLFLLVWGLLMFNINISEVKLASAPDIADIIVLIIGVFSWLAVHELAHIFFAGTHGVSISAWGVKRFGGMLPLPFVDTRRAWVIDRWKHAQIALAGPLFDVFILALLLGAELFLPVLPGGVHLIIIFGMIMLMSNINPCKESDLALMLQAIARDPELRRKAMMKINHDRQDAAVVGHYRIVIFCYVLIFITLVISVVFQVALPFMLT
ncbi:MAG: hypothetical protein ACRDCA_19085 [Serratia sp. (in: enterobacteria)]|uniref:hypothetical protein n=1 Tax=Serratia sp. (in: enterobacteria) TaxID=616 RepID=UPI003F32856D